MLYDIRLDLHYGYDASVNGGRHIVRVQPLSDSAVQRVVAASVDVVPLPSERIDFVDFFGNHATSFALREPHSTLDVSLKVRVSVVRDGFGLDVSPSLAKLRSELKATWSLAAQSPHHFTSGSALASVSSGITAFARECSAEGRSAAAIAETLSNRIHDDFRYDSGATSVATDAREAFALKRGVCQDFSHVMIAGLRGLGIPAAYVSGFLRTIPPPGKPRLEGADAMHAWVRVWLGRDMGWREFDPTNRMRVSDDHITVGYGRDYADVSPIVGRLRTSGPHSAHQSVDVVPVD